MDLVVGHHANALDAFETQATPHVLPLCVSLPRGHPAWVSFDFTFKENEPQTEEASAIILLCQGSNLGLWILIVMVLLWANRIPAKQQSDLISYLCITSLGKLFIKT